MELIYKGRDAIAELSRHLNDREDGASSHWQAMHGDFSFEDGSLGGLKGFGECDPPATGLGKVAHSILQRRFRSMGARLSQFREIDKIAADIAARQNRQYNMDILRQSLTLSWLFDKIPETFASSDFVAVIGDGFATLSSLILESTTDVRVVIINLTKTLLVDLVYLEKTLPEIVPALVTDGDGLDAAMKDTSIRVIALRSDDYKLLGKMHLCAAINIASMQEMTPPTVAGYFTALRCSANEDGIMFYCCNREEKTLPDGTVSRFADYPWNQDDLTIVDELCPWHQGYYNLRPPFYHPYDGPHRHRLAMLKPEN